MSSTINKYLILVYRNYLLFLLNLIFILILLYNIYCIELKYGFRYNITKSYLKYIKC